MSFPMGSDALQGSCKKGVPVTGLVVGTVTSALLAGWWSVSWGVALAMLVVAPAVLLVMRRRHPGVTPLALATWVVGVAVCGVGLVVAGTWVSGLLADGAHGAHAGAGHPQMADMGVVEHALHQGALAAPALLGAALVVGLATAGLRALRDLRLHHPVRGAARWSALGGLVAGVALVAAPVAPVGATPVVQALEDCNSETARRSYDVAAVNAFIPYSRWDNDSGEAQRDPVSDVDHLTDGDPAGMLFVLQQDKLAVQHWHQPIVGTAADGYAGDPAEGRRLRPRPLALRANVGECVEVTLTNELDPDEVAGVLPQVDPRVSLQAFGVSYNPNTSDGSSVGYNADSTVAVGESHTYYWRAPKSEGLYLFRDMGMPAGAEDDGGGAEHGLYGGLAVEPAGSRWYDPVTGSELSSQLPDGQYDAVANQSGDLYIDTVVVDSSGRRFRESIQFAQDIVPIINPPTPEGEDPEAVERFERFSMNFGSEPEEKRVKFNRENPDAVWCEECVSEETVLSSWVYGDPGLVKLASGSGPWLPEEPDWGAEDPLAEPGGLPAPNVEDCSLLLTNDPDETQPASCYVANVTRAYQGDPLKIRFGVNGVYETHVFHLHAHTWPAEPDDTGVAGAVPPKPATGVLPKATTIDSQTYSPWTAFTADLNYGAGGRVGTVGDSIFHCHLYTHFSAGFWSLLRVHDTLEDGSTALPNGQRVNPYASLRAIAPDAAMAASVPPEKNPPTLESPGYPRFIPGDFGSRAPQPVGGVWQRQFENGDPVLDAEGTPVDAPVMRAVGTQALDPALLEATQDITAETATGELTLAFGGETTAPVALPAAASDLEDALLALDGIEAVDVQGEGTGASPWRVRLGLWRIVDDLTITAELSPPGTAVTVTPSDGFTPADPETARMAHRLATEDWVSRSYHDPDYAFGEDSAPEDMPLPGAPLVDPCPEGARTVTYRASVIQMPLTYNDEGWRDVQGRIIVADEDVNDVLNGVKEPEPFFFRVNAQDCIDFELTNRTPNVIGDDAYQQLMMTNMVGSHIHLVNFDVVASDGSSNGWNYQQAAFTQEQAEHTAAVLSGDVVCTEGQDCLPALPTDRDPVAEADDPRGNWLADGQTIKERWYADYELRTAFMHDHHFAGTLQNRGLFSALIVEPEGFDTRDPQTGEFRQPVNTAGRGAPVCDSACEGTAYGATMDMVGPAAEDDFREFGVAVADFVPLFTASDTHAQILDRANAIAPPAGPIPAPQGDQGGMGINYRNAPLQTRQFTGTPPTPPADPTQPISPAALEAAGWVDPAYAYSSRIWGDPETPLLRANRGDNVRFRLIQGSHEEMHNFSIHGTRWKGDDRDPASPYINARPIGVSEAFNIEAVGVDCGLGTSGPCFRDELGSGPRVADFLYGGTGVEDHWSGVWGVMRVFDQTTDNGGLLSLPDNPISLPAGNAIPPPDPDATVPPATSYPSCPSGAPVKTFDVSAIDHDIVYNRYGDHDPYGLAYVLAEDVAAVRAGEQELEPLVLRVNEGDCVRVNLTNDVDWEQFAAHGALGTLDGDAPITREPVTPGQAADDPADTGVPWIAGNRVSLHPALVRYDVRSSDGTVVGYNPDQTAGPGETVEYAWFADEVTYQDPASAGYLTDGELGAVPLLEFGDVRGHRHHGLLASLVVGPPDATFNDPITGAEVTSGAQVDVRPGSDGSDYRDVVLMHANGLNLRDAAGQVIIDPILNDWPDAGERGVSYRNAPVHHRLGLARPIGDQNDPNLDPNGPPFSDADFGERLANAFSSTFLVDGAPIGDPDTPIIRAYQGDPVRMHVVQSADRARTVEYAVAGHNWLQYPFDAGSVRTGVTGSMATGSVASFHLAGAGGDQQAVGDYRYGVVHGTMGLSSGSWGILRVYQRPAPGTERALTPLDQCPNPYQACNPLRVINENLTQPPGIPALGLAADPEVASVGDTVEVTAALTLGGQALGAGRQVSFTGAGGTQLVTTGSGGTATITVPVDAYPASGVLSVTATATITLTNPYGVFPVADMVDVLVLDPNDAVGPTVTAVDPVDEATDVALASSVRLTFSERVDPTTVPDRVRLRDTDTGTVVPATVVENHDADTTVSEVVITPDAPLARSTAYAVEVDPLVTDLSGNVMAAAFASTFTTTADLVVERVFGPNRYGTAAEISRTRFPDTAGTVYVANGLDFPDALAGGPAAARDDGALLLVRQDSVPPETVAEVERLAPQEIVVLGGAGAVSDGVVTALEQLVGPGGTVTRVAGGDRYATATAVSGRYAVPGVDTVFLASGTNFPDALAAGAPAARDGSPILLTRPDSLPPVTRAELLRLDPARVVVLGGTGAVSAAVETEVGTLADTVDRVSGANRYETAVAVSQEFYTAPTDAVHLATGLSFPDALAAGPLAGAAGGPLLLTPTGGLAPAVSTELLRLQPGLVRILGGTAAVSQAVEDSVLELLQ